MAPMNPEFKRNLILELSVQRLIAMPAILFLVYTVAGLSGEAAVVVWIAKAVMIVLPVVWGSRLAADSVLGEVSTRTWDGQRMSALGPWTMSWGKLLGSTVFVWYATAISVPVFLYWSGGQFGELARLILLGLFGQSVALLASLVLLRLRPRRLRFQVTLAQLIALGAASSYWSLMHWDYIDPAWYGFRVVGTVFPVLSAIAFLGWAWLGIYRLMRGELQFRCWPWGWSAFVLFCAVYVAGFSFSDVVGLHSDLVAAPGVEPVLRLSLAFITVAALTWAAAYVEPKGFVALRRWSMSLFRRDAVRTLEATPMWAPSLLMTVAAGVILSLLWFASPDARNVFEAVAEIDSLAAFVVAVLLFLSRDIALFHFLTLDGRAQRAHLAALVYITVLYALFPMILASLDLDGLLPVLLPMPVGNPLLIILPVLIQVGLVAGLLVWRWRRVARNMAAAAQASGGFDKK